MKSLCQRLVPPLDKGLDWCVENWRVLIVLIPAATFVFFALVLFFGLTVYSALAATRTLAIFQICLAAVILVLHLKYRRQRSQWLDAADAIEAMLCKDDAFGDWDAFLANPSDDPELERVRLHCVSLSQERPPVVSGEYFDAQGVDILEGYMRRLRVGLATRVLERSGLLSAERAGPKRAERRHADRRQAEVPTPDNATFLDLPEPMPPAPKPAMTMTTPVAKKAATTKKATVVKKTATTKKATVAKKTATTKKAAAARKATTKKAAVTNTSSLRISKVRS